MTRKEFGERMDQIDPESPTAVDDYAALFEQDYEESEWDLNDPAVLEDLLSAAQKELKDHMGKYDALKKKIDNELRRAGATEAQINWGLFGDVELPTIAYLRVSRMAVSLIETSYRIRQCLGELKLLGKYTDAVDPDEITRIRKEYGRRYG